MSLTRCMRITLCVQWMWRMGNMKLYSGNCATGRCVIVCPCNSATDGCKILSPDATWENMFIAMPRTIVFILAGHVSGLVLSRYSWFNMMFLSIHILSIAKSFRPRSLNEAPQCQSSSSMMRKRSWKGRLKACRVTGAVGCS